MIYEISLGKIIRIELVLLLLLGCVGSKVQIIQSDLRLRPGSIVYVLPLGLPEEIGIAQDWRKTGDTLTTKDGEKIQIGMYQYSFGEGDIINLRNSIINSLKESQSFSDVIYLNTIDIDVTGNHSAIYVHLQINKTDMFQNYFSSKCLISGKLILKSEKESILFEDDINVEVKSIVSIRDAKNKAIEQFVNDVIESFNKF